MTGITVVPGPNFSGRTERILSALKPEKGDAYVSLEVYNLLSGLAPTVEQELELHREYPFAEPLRHLEGSLIDATLYDHHPFSQLSGGEQTALVIVSALHTCPSHIALDCALEQLDPNKRASLLKWLDRSYSGECLLADNRLKDMASDGLRAVDSWPVGTGTGYGMPIAAGAFQPTVPYTTELLMHDVWFAYEPGHPVLRGIDLHLAPGVIYVLSGANGAGKSTLARVLAGILRPARGSIATSSGPNTPYKSPGALVAYHFQNPDVQLFATKVRDEVRRKDSDSTYCDMLLSSFGLAAKGEWHPSDLAFPERKRLAMAATFALPRPWVILDEPTLGQDDQAVQALVRMLHTMKNVGIGVIVISHAPSFRRLLGGVQLTLVDGVVHDEPEGS